MSRVVVAPRGEINLVAVSLRERDRLVLDRLDLTVEQGQVCAVVGPNGSGKSSLLRIVAALSRPTAGQVQVGGWNLFDHPDRIRRLVGYVPEAPGLLNRLTPREQLDLVGAQHGLGRADRRLAADSMLELVDLSEQSAADVDALSRGQRKRLALALALVHDPAVIVLDEPLTDLDDDGRAELIAILQELRTLGRTILVASQSAAELAGVCDQLARLSEGRLQASSGQVAVSLTWIEVVDEPSPALHALRELPGVEDLRANGNLVTFAGLSDGIGRARVADWLVQRGIRLAGLGSTELPATSEPT